MFRKILIVVIISAWSLAPLSAQLSGHASGRIPGASRSQWIAASLLAIKEAADTAEAKNLFGATRLHGFLLVNDDESGSDVILVLEKENGRPALRLDDLAVAHKNVSAGNARPACTIDPRSVVLKELSEITATVNAQRKPDAIQRTLEKWKRIGESPQDVRVFNVDPESHFSSIMVKADYDLKSLCNGAEKAAGIASLTDRLARQVQSEIAKTGTSSGPVDTQNRFWFNPGQVSYRSDNKFFLLSKCEVNLLTEQEAITQDGERSGIAQPNPLAKAFADDLSKRFSELCSVKPVYRELENLYRAVAVMCLMTLEVSHSHELLEGLFDNVEIPYFQFDNALPGRVAVKKIEGKVKNGTYALWLPSCGGVTVDISSRTMVKEQSVASRMSQLAKQIVRVRPNNKAMSWEITAIE